MYTGADDIRHARLQHGARDARARPLPARTRAKPRANRGGGWGCFCGSTGRDRAYSSGASGRRRHRTRGGGGGGGGRRRKWREAGTDVPEQDVFFLVGEGAPGREPGAVDVGGVHGLFVR